MAYLSLGPEDAYEWGDVSLEDLKIYNFRHVEWDPHRATSKLSKEIHQSSLGDTLGISPHGDQNEAILMLGCGNSRLGEEMVEQGGWRGPVIQVDVSGRVVESMSQRCQHLVTQGKMSFVQDDACELSAFRDASIDSCLDKGLIDAIHCGDEVDQLTKILKSVGRVLKPGAPFVFFSFSRPEFLLPRLMKDEMADIRRRRWNDLQVQELETILLYKMQKAEDSGKNKQLRYRPNRIRNDKFKK